MKGNLIVKHKDTLIRLFLSISIVLVIFLLMLLLDSNMFTINPYDSGLNDEAFYLKQIRSVMFHGLPKGYFGYNGSTAKIGGFGAWSPLLIYVYAFFGLLFRNSKYVVYIVNIIFVVLSLFTLFQYNKLNKKEMLIYLLPICSCVGLRYTYSGMTEAIYYAAVILIFSSYISTKKNYWGILVILLASLTRPYFLLFLLLFFYKDKYKLKEYLVIGFLALLILILYFEISKYFQAPYLYKILEFDRYFDYFKNYGIFPLIKMITTELFNSTKEIVKFIISDFVNSDEPAIGYVLLIITGFYLLINLFMTKKKTYLLMLLIIIVEYIVVVILYYYKPGFRHIYIVLLLIWYLIINENKDNKSLIISFLILNIVFTYFYYLKANRWGTWPAQTPYVIEDNSNFIDNKDMNKNTVYIEVGFDWDTYRVMNYLPDYYGYNLCLSDYIPSIVNFNSGYLVLSNSSNNISLFNDRKIMFRNERVTIFEL